MGEHEASGIRGNLHGDKTPQGRPRELEDWLNGQIYHPLSMKFAKALVPTPITPNMVSIAGGLMIVLTAVAYGQSGAWEAVLIGLALHMSWHVLDGADGDLARLTGRTSSTGEVIDGICDYVGHIVLYVSLGFMLAEEVGSLTAWMFAFGAGLGRIVQAAHYEVQRRQYQHWVYGTKWLRVSAKDAGPPRGIIGLVARSYVNLGKLLAPGGREVDAIVEQCGEERLPALRKTIKEHSVPVLRSTYLLSANYRTIALGLSMLAGSPIYFFAFEAIGLTFVMIVSIVTALTVTKQIKDQAKSLR